MAIRRACRLELHSDGQAILLERTDDPEQARDILARHSELLTNAGTVGRLVLLDEVSGQVLARRQIKAGGRRKRTVSVN